MNDLKASQRVTRRDLPSAKALAERASKPNPGDRPSGVRKTKPDEKRTREDDDDDEATASSR